MPGCEAVPGGEGVSRRAKGHTCRPRMVSRLVTGSGAFDDPIRCSRPTAAAAALPAPVPMPALSPRAWARLMPVEGPDGATWTPPEGAPGCSIIGPRDGMGRSPMPPPPPPPLPPPSPGAADWPSMPGLGVMMRDPRKLPPRALPLDGMPAPMGGRNDDADIRRPKCALPGPGDGLGPATWPAAAACAAREGRLVFGCILLGLAKHLAFLQWKPRLLG